MRWRSALAWLLVGCALHELWCAFGLWFSLGWGGVDGWIVGRAAAAVAGAGVAARGGRVALTAVAALAGLAGAMWAVELVRDSVFTTLVRGPLWGVTALAAWRARGEAPAAVSMPVWWPGAAALVAQGALAMAGGDALVGWVNDGGQTWALAIGALVPALLFAMPVGRRGVARGLALLHASAAALATWGAVAAWVTWLHGWWMSEAMAGAVPAVVGVAVASTLIGTLPRWPEAGRASVYAACVVGAVWWARLPGLTGPLSHAYAPDREVGSFPHRGGVAVPTQVAGEAPATATILPDGSRRCGGADGDGTIAFVGDSFTFGQGLPDEGTLCWAVQEALADVVGGWRVINLGQPGANAVSAVDTAAFAIASHGARVVVLGVLPGDDGRAFELNGLRRLTRQPWMLLAGTVVDVPTAVEVMMLSHELYPVEGYQRAITLGAARRAAALGAAHEVPVILDVNVPPGAGASALLRDLAGLADAEPWLLWGGDGLLDPDPEQPDRPTVFAQDGHPTAWGNRVKAARLRPALEAAIRMQRTAP